MIVPVRRRVAPGDRPIEIIIRIIGYLCGVAGIILLPMNAKFMQMKGIFSIEYVSMLILMVIATWDFVLTWRRMRNPACASDSPVLRCRNADD